MAIDRKKFRTVGFTHEELCEHQGASLTKVNDSHKTNKALLMVLLEFCGFSTSL